MKFGDAIHQLGEPRDNQEAIDAIREEHGRGAASFVANALGISARQARRYLSGAVRKPPAARQEGIRDAADRNRIAAKALRGANTIDAGTVEVISKSDGKSQGSRTIGNIQVTGKMAAILDRAAALIEQGKIEEGEALVSDAITEGYGAAGLGISDYTDGLDVG